MSVPVTAEPRRAARPQAATLARAAVRAGTPALPAQQRTRQRPGPMLLAFGGGMVLAALLCFVWSGAAWLVPLLAAAAVALAVMDFRYLRRTWPQVTVRRELPVCVGRAAAFRSVLRVKNAGATEVRGAVRDVLPAEAQPDYWHEALRVGAGTEAETGIELRIAVRGLHEFGPVWIRLRGPWGVLEGQRRYECAGAVKVVPETAVSRDALHKNARAEMRLLEQLTRTRLRGGGTEFECLAEFRDGDDPRRIDWRSTARLSRPVVRRYQVEQHRDVVIVLDCGRLMGTAVGSGTKLDCAVDAALMLSRVALTKGDRCGLALFDDKVLGYLPPLSGPSAHHTFLESIYNAQSRWREANFSAMFAVLQARQTKRALVVVLSDIVDADTTSQFRRALASLSERHVVLFAALQTPLLGEIVAGPAASMLDVCRTGVGYSVMREREKALHSLRHAGIHVLDVEPRELTVPLLNRYIDLRERNLV